MEEKCHGPCKRALDAQRLQHRLANTKEVYALCDAEERGDDQRTARRPLQERRGALTADDASVQHTGRRWTVRRQRYTRHNVEGHSIMCCPHLIQSRIPL